MNKLLLLPKLAVLGIRKNGIVYLPYILTILFAASIYFIFSSIVANPLLETVPYSAYVIMLLMIGKYLLAIVLIPFLFYTNSFLFKRRKKELGLYTVLGLEKKHVGIMLTLESLLIFVLSVGGGMVVAIVFSKLMFLILLKMSNMPPDTGFTLNAASFLGTAQLFGFIFIVNLISNLWQITKVNSTQLLQGGKKGEKEPKHLVFTSILGVMFLAAGYGVSISAKLDSLIFIKFPMAVILVIIGTYFLFTAGIIQYLKHLKKNKGIYYQKAHFITVSGMLYRMKKSAAGLVNICLFSTMIMITLTCTVALSLGEKDAIAFSNPFDAAYTFRDVEAGAMADFELKLQKEAKAYQIELTDLTEYSYKSMDMIQEENQFVGDIREGIQDQECSFRILPLSVYNSFEEKTETLLENECLILYTAGFYEYQNITLNNQTLFVKEKLDSIKIDNQNPHSISRKYYYLIVKDEEIVNQLSPNGSIYTTVGVDMKGTERNIREFIKQADLIYADSSYAFRNQNIYDYGDQIKSMDGGLLFIGIFFGLVFAAALLLVMYYKQISEGLEDQDSFHIMKKVGMSREDIHATIKKQILLVFTLPAGVAILHICAALPMLINLMYALNLYHTMSTIFSTVIVAAAYLVFYTGSYLITAKTYYKIIQ